MQAPLRATWAAIGIGHEKASMFWNTKGLPLSTQTPLLLPQEAFRCNTFSHGRRQILPEESVVAEAYFDLARLRLYLYP